MDSSEIDNFYTEDQKAFLSVFKGCFKSKTYPESSKSNSEIPASSLHEIPQHLLFAFYLL